MTRRFLAVAALMYCLVAPVVPCVAKDALITVGDKAPEFTLPASDGSSISLKDFAGKKSVVLFFYPKDDVGVCKKQACLFRDNYEKFTAAGAEVLGVSADTIESHKRFVEVRKLPYKLLSDRDGNVKKLYGIPRTAAGLLPARVTFVIDPNGVVRFTFNSLLNADPHISQALEIVKTIEAQKTR